MFFPPFLGLDADKRIWLDHLAPSNGFLDGIMYHRCPNSVKRMLCDTKQEDFAPCADLAVQLINFPGIPVDQGVTVTEKTPKSSSIPEKDLIQA